MRFRPISEFNNRRRQPWGFKQESTTLAQISRMTYVYLDQGPWISLRTNDEYSDIREFVEKQVAAENISFQLIHTLLTETGKHIDEEVREKHFKYMLELSNGNGLRHYHDAESIEIRDFVAAHVGREPTKVSEIRTDDAPSLYGQWSIQYEGEDIAESNKVDQHEVEELEAVMQTDLVFDLAMDVEADQSQGDNEWESDLVENIEETREVLNNHFNDNGRQRRYLIYNFFYSDIIPEMIRVYLSFELWPSFEQYNFEKYVQEGDKDVEELFQSFPAVYTYLILTTGRDLEKSYSAKENDVYDIFSLSVAIPYSDVVVTEPFWKTIAQRANIDQIYDTEIISDLNKLPNEIDTPS